ncbi:alpha/beta fold hydrolase [Paenibacillus donghaensis]|uniref:2-hydroxy-6-oxo-6-phenylhexa-2,4-dienoate hydrolase n=1 Tax=Paenibacillus donghaensis TaxID=414771 RepID=A0A2Z2K311_9BACL|nr:alpha/beta hydrolase [Paenibacillus donghaensis]ASA19576.1 2-hydroxy-6-oxo-6-phenylhexa-2,4-dienoate hydrolase [Paenibacillus donghaensis]
MIYSNSDITFNYEERGEGTPILILHGNGPDHRMMMACLEPVFAEQERFRRIYVDLPGFGQTPAAEWIKSSDDMLEAVKRMVQALIPGKRFAVVGQSYGGYLARGLVKDYGDLMNGIFLLCPCIIAEPSQRELPEHQVVTCDEVFLAELGAEDRQEFCSISVKQTREVWERYKQEVMVGLALADETFMKGIRASGGYSFSEEIDDIPLFNQPGLILNGRQDSMVGYKDACKLVDLYPKSVFAVLDEAGHNLHLEQVELFNGLTRDWLERVRSVATAEE